MEDFAPQLGGRPAHARRANDLLKLIPALRDYPGPILVCATNFICSLDSAFSATAASTAWSRSGCQMHKSAPPCGSASVLPPGAPWNRPCTTSIRSPKATVRKRPMADGRKTVVEPRVGVRAAVAADFLVHIGAVARTWPCPKAAQSQLFFLKIKYMTRPTENISVRAKGYPNAQWSSGMMSKFMP